MTTDTDARSLTPLAPATPTEWLLLEPHVRALSEARQRLEEAKKLAAEAESRFTAALAAVAPVGAAHFDPNLRLWYRRAGTTDENPVLAKMQTGD